MKERKTPLWMGFLDAGKKSSAVVRDHSLDTGNPATIYLFNLVKGRILEYRKDIVEAKLRELTPDESDMIQALHDAFETANASFVPRTKQRPVLPPRQRKQPRESAARDFDADLAWSSYDDDEPDPFAADSAD